MGAHNRTPTAEDASYLLRFLPGFEDRDEPIATWEGGSYDETTRVITLAYPNYAADVIEFFHSLHQPPWLHFDYMSDRTRDLVADIEKMNTAMLEEIKAVLTWCARGERFCDGHWISVLEGGVVQAALHRLAALFPDAASSPNL